MAAIGPDFISLQVSDLERSAAFYEQQLGLAPSKARNRDFTFASEMAENAPRGRA